MTHWYVKSFIVGRCIFLCYCDTSITVRFGGSISICLCRTRDGCVAVGWNKSGAYLIIVALSLPDCVGLTRVPLYGVCQTTSFVSTHGYSRLLRSYNSKTNGIAACEDTQRGWEFKRLYLRQRSSVYIVSKNKAKILCFVMSFFYLIN